MYCKFCRALFLFWLCYIIFSGYDTISYPFFADADTGIYPHAASQYHARPKAKRGNAMLSVEKFLYPRKQTKGDEFIRCSNDGCHTIKRFRRFETQLSLFSCLNHCIKSVLLGRIAAARTVDGGCDHRVISASSMTFLSLYTSRWWRQTLNTGLYFTVISQSGTIISTEHGIDVYSSSSLLTVSLGLRRSH